MPATATRSPMDGASTIPSTSLEGAIQQAFSQVRYRPIRFEGALDSGMDFNLRTMHGWDINDFNNLFWTLHEAGVIDRTKLDVEELCLHKCSTVHDVVLLARKHATLRYR